MTKNQYNAEVFICSTMFDFFPLLLIFFRIYTLISLVWHKVTGMEYFMRIKLKMKRISLHALAKHCIPACNELVLSINDHRRRTWTLHSRLWCLRRAFRYLSLSCSSFPRFQARFNCEVTGILHSETGWLSQAKPTPGSVDVPILSANSILAWCCSKTGSKLDWWNISSSDTRLQKKRPGEEVPHVTHNRPDVGFVNHKSRFRRIYSMFGS